MKCAGGASLLILMISPLLLERMERSQGGMRRISPAARAHQAERGVIMYRHAVGPLLSCLAVLAHNMLWVCQYSSCALYSQRYRKPFNSQYYSF